MSKCIDKLNRIAKGETAPIGFRRAGSESLKKRIQLVAIISELAEVAGADAVLIEVSGQTGIEAFKNVPANVPWGAWLKNGNDRVKQLEESGCDFVVFSPDTPVTLIEGKDTGKILEADIAIPDAALRALMSLPVEAVLISLPVTAALTWQDVITVQKFGSIPGKPLFVKVASKLTAKEIEALWNAGANALVIEGELEETCKEIEKADFTLRRKNDRSEPVLRQIDNGNFDDLDDEDDE